MMFLELDIVERIIIVVLAFFLALTLLIVLPTIIHGKGGVDVQNVANLMNNSLSCAGERDREGKFPKTFYKAEQVLGIFDDHVLTSDGKSYALDQCQGAIRIP